MYSDDPCHLTGTAEAQAPSPRDGSSSSYRARPSTTRRAIFTVGEHIFTVGEGNFTVGEGKLTVGEGKFTVGEGKLTFGEWEFTVREGISKRVRSSGGLSFPSLPHAHKLQVHVCVRWLLALWSVQALVGERSFWEYFP
jgi:hypothetical protein